MKQLGHLNIIGVGPSGPPTATLQAIEEIKKVDSVIATEQIVQLFKKYIGNKPVLFDPWEGFWHYKGKHFLGLIEDEMIEFRKARFSLRDMRVNIIKEHLEKGENIGLLENGNQSFFGPAHWYIEQLDHNQTTIIPGMGADNIALAALGKSIMPAYDTRFVLQTAPIYLRDWDKILNDIKVYPISMILYMSLEHTTKLFGSLKKIYPSDMPCAAVFWAGFPDKEIVLKGILSNMEEKILKVEERFMGILFVGRFLEGKPYESLMKRQ